MKSQMQKDADSSQGCKSLPNLGPAGQTGFSDSGVSSQLSDTELTAIATLEREVCLPLAGHTFLMVTMRHGIQTISFITFQLAVVFRHA